MLRSPSEPSSCIPGPIAFDNEILHIFGAEDDEDSSHLALFETNGEAVPIHSLSLSEYKDYAVNFHMEQFVIPDYALCDIHDKRRRDIGNFVYPIGFQHSHGMISVLFFSAWNPVGTTGLSRFR